MTNISFPICATMIVLLLNIVFYSKERIENKETNIYKKILGVCLLESFLACIIVVLLNTNGIEKYIYYLDKIDYILIISGIYLLEKYIIEITNTNQQIKNRYINLSKIVLFIIIGLILILEIKVIYKDGIIDTAGPASIALYTGGTIYLVLMLILVINKSISKEKLETKKLAPLLILLILGGVMVLMRLFWPEILMISIIFSFVTLIMYFTIENPDIKLLEKIELAKTQAEKANAAKTEFLSSMSHEIRTPLNAIVGFSESISEAETLEEAKENAKDILTASNNLLEIVNGILDISKIEANKMEIVNTEYNLKEEVEKLVKLIKPRIGEKPIELKYYIAPDIPGKLYGDKGKIKEIMTNILTNAVKYTKEGFIELKVNCINKDNESSLVISVEDTGRGIKPENIDKLFTKFERLNEDRNTTIEGAGLGLAITKKLVEMMGGKIIVQSVYGSGSKFTVYLKQRIITRTSVSFENNDNQGELNLSGKTVLVVDDNTLNIKVAEKLLKKYSIKVDSCETGFECIDKIKQGNHYDLILMDDMMPKITGTETLHLLQEIPTFKDKTVVLTANAIEGMKEKYIEEGFDDYIAKPIEKYELERVLRKYLNKEKEHIDFEPIPESFYDISDTIVEKLNSEEIPKNEKTQ